MPDFEWDSILVEADGGGVGRYYVGKETMQKILCVGLWWPMLQKDSKVYCKVCDACQRTSRPS